MGPTTTTSTTSTTTTTTTLSSSEESTSTVTSSDFDESSASDEQLFVDIGADEGADAAVEEGSGAHSDGSNVSEEASSQSPTTTTASSEAVEVENTEVVNDEEEDDFEVSVQVQDGDKPNQDVWIPVELGPDGSPQIASGFEGVAPPVNGMYNCTELGEGLYNCTIVAGPCKGDNLVTSDAMEIKNHIENLESNLCQSAGASGDIKPGVVFPDQVIDNVPEAPVAPATTESPLDADVTDADDDSEDDGEEPGEPSPTFHTLTPDNLETASYQDICGTTPWKNKTFRDAQASPRSGRRMGGGDQFWNQFNRRGKIVNGERAEYGEWPWQVSLRQWRTGEHQINIS